MTDIIGQHLDYFSLLICVYCCLITSYQLCGLICLTVPPVMVAFLCFTKTPNNWQQLNLVSRN